MVVISISHFPDQYEIHEVTFEVDEQLAEIILHVKNEEMANVMFNEIRDLILPTFYLADVGIIFLNRIDALLQFPYTPTAKQ